MRRTKHLTKTSVVFLTLACTGPTLAGSPSECNSALIISTYNRIDSSKSDWRMASFVEKDTYNTIKQSVGASGVIYGVPVGLDYDNYKQNIDQFKTSTNESLSQEQFHNVSWTGLSPESANSYNECIRSKSKGLYIIPDKASDSDLSFRVIYTVTGGSPNPLPVTWSGGAAKDAQLPKKISAGEKIIIVERPLKSATLVINDDSNAGLSDSVVLAPLPDPIPPDQKLANRCIINNTEQPASITRDNSFSWTCNRLRAGTYEVSIDVAPSSARPVRVGWHADITFIGDQGKETTALATSSGQVIDSGINAGIGTKFQSTGNLVTVKQPGLLPIIKIYIDSTFEHNDFSRQSNDPINIPKAVNISVIRK